MSGWIITSWIGVAIMTAVNVFVFLKLKEASEKMLKTLELSLADCTTGAY
jgi:hypothetical protein